MKLRTNVVKKSWPFRIWFKDGSTADVTVEAESYHLAVYSLPSGKTRYEYLGKKGPANREASE